MFELSGHSPCPNHLKKTFFQEEDELLFQYYIVHCRKWPSKIYWHCNLRSEYDNCDNVSDQCCELSCTCDISSPPTDFSLSGYLCTLKHKPK